MNLSSGARAGARFGGVCAWLVSLAWLTACGTSSNSPSDTTQAGTAGQLPGGGGAINTPAPGAGSGGASTSTPVGPSSGTGGAPAVAGGAPSGVAGSSGGASPAPSGGAGSPAVGMAGSAGSGVAGAPNTSGPACTTDEERKFSFFVTSQAGLQRLSGNADGFGGDLGGLAGADKICQQLAESSSPCQSTKVWRAFLSTTTEDAIDRIGKGPWYDRRGRLLANGLDDLLPLEDTEEGGRPRNADPEIRNDFPNEDGTPNQFPDGGTRSVDNHQVITGSGSDGRLYKQEVGSGMSGSAGASGAGGRSGFPGKGGLGFSGTTCRDAEGWTPEAATCWNWTSSEFKGCPRVGHSWGAFSGWDWISVWNESGCAPGGTIIQEGAGDDSRKIGSGGGYGGFYCFAVTP